MSKPDNSGRSQGAETGPVEDSTGRVLALDLGTVRVGVAVSDELRLTVRPLPALERTNWKRLLRDVAELCSSFDVKRVVLGLPLRLDGGEGDAAAEARRVARNLGLSLPVPVSLQDERHTSHDSRLRLRAEKLPGDEIARRIDSEAAALILSDYLSSERESKQPSS
ncbi:MAG TPA: Holliday junction resolvase RuvX [Pyrinomonadaceae bacterium]|jgi:putative Holliday junction resolvase|nr:Holliday junction resolvase RuvX [Pyrinomonadaceae bacterium]